MFSARPPIHAPLCESERERVCVRERAGVHTFEGTGGFSNIFDWIIHSHFKQKSGWWFGTLFIFPCIGSFIIPTD